MKHSLLSFACAAAMGALAISAHAQYGNVTRAGAPTAPSTPSAQPTQTDAAYGRDMARCSRLVGASRADCMHDAQAANDRRVSEMPSGTATAGGGGLTHSAPHASK